MKVDCTAEVIFALSPRRNYSGEAFPELHAENRASFTFEDGILTAWTSFAVKVDTGRLVTSLTMSSNEEHWVVLRWNSVSGECSVVQAADAFEQAKAYWEKWSGELQITSPQPREELLRRSAMTVQLLSHAHHDGAVAALTTSLPERIGGDLNYDYRFAWVRDASLSLATLARMGKVGEVQSYIDWLCRLHSLTAAPLQVCYRLDGNPHLEQSDVMGVAGYRNSRPVRQGNRAALQMQLGSMGFFADCVLTYINHEGEWSDEFWHQLKSAAEFTSLHWSEKDSGVWELPNEAHYVASRVMSWVVLDRAVQVADRTGHGHETGHWREVASMIHTEVMDHGWCDAKNSFRQRYGSDALDAAALLIPLMGFLPVEHSRVAGTMSAIERELVVHGLVHRFDPSATFDRPHPPIGEFEGAFLPCVFWHAHTLAKMGRCDQAETILAKCESIAGDTGLFAEEVDARNHTFLGNTPLLFAHAEYVSAVIELNAARAREQKKAY